LDIYFTPLLNENQRPDELHVEVKGCRGAVPRFFISRTQLRAAKSDSDLRLAIIESGKPALIFNLPRLEFGADGTHQSP
jgi:hypothetical protein